MKFRLREILTSKKIAFSTFADRLGVSPTSLPVTDKFYPAISSIERIADELQMPAWELIEECEVPLITPYVKERNVETLDQFVVKRITQTMKEKRMTMKDMAEKMGISSQSIGQTLKRGRMSLKVVEQMAAALGVETHILLTTEEDIRAEVARRRADMLMQYSTMAESMGVLAPQKEEGAVESESNAKEEKADAEVSLKEQIGQQMIDFVLGEIAKRMDGAEEYVVDLGEYTLTVHRKQTE